MAKQKSTNDGCGHAASDARTDSTECFEHVPGNVLDVGEAASLKPSDDHGHDPVFGDLNADGPNYRSVGWVRTSILMMKTTIGIGALSLPHAFHILGMIPGVLVMLVVAFMASWSAYMIGAFKLRHPEVYSLQDAVFLMFGPTGREVCMVIMQLYFIFTAGSAILSVSTALNALSSHGACTAVFVAVTAIFACIFSSIRTLSRISWLAWIGLACILASLFAISIAVATGARPSAAPQEGAWTSDYKLFGDAHFAQIMAAVSSIVFSYSSVPYYFAIICEMKEPRHFFKAMCLSQSVITGIYLIVGIVVYYYCGSHVASPALGSAGATMKKVSYGLALPGLLVTTMIVCHIPAKNIFVRLLQDVRPVRQNSRIQWLAWLSCTSAVVVIGYIVASAIPEFSGLVSLIGALLGTIISIQPYGAMWLYDNWNEPRRSGWWMAGVCWSGFMIVAGTYVTAGGSYGSITNIVQLYQTQKGAVAWSCADNSNSS